MAKEIQTKNQLSRGKTLDGINYCINQEVSLKAFLEDGDIPMDNNATESALRSFCLHKHRQSGWCKCQCHYLQHHRNGKS